MECEECLKRGKTWNGSDPTCGFDNYEAVFTEDNWKCATLGSLREIAHALNNTYFMDDNWIGIIPLQGEGFIVLNWYKSRGRVSSAKFMCDDIDEPLCIEYAEKALTQYSELLVK